MIFRKAFFVMLALGSSLSVLHTQDQSPIPIRIRVGDEMILAAADVQPTSSDKATQLADALKTFNQVLWDDLSFSGFFVMAGKGFYPPEPIVLPEDVNYDAWSTLPFQANFLTAGALDVSGDLLRAELRIFDMKQRTMSFGQRISGDADQVRAIAHRWADEVVYKLTAGRSRGIASTKIAYTSRSGDAQEIYVMDYDGHNQQAFTHGGSTNLFPTWAPDNSKLSFLSYRTGKPEINIYSYLDGSRLPFPMFNSFTNTPVISPDGTHIVFSLRTTRGDSDLFVSRLDGSERRNITNNPAIDTSPTWSPSGKQIAFASDRWGGVSQIFICDLDGANVRRIIREGGDADAPVWSPDGRYIAFQWKPYLSVGYDIFIAEVSSMQSRQLTSGSGSNENPSWAPDGRHLAFDSDRSGRSQIYIMLADGTEIRRVTSQGTNRYPSWSGYFRRE